ncbi:MAG: hypothetical protein PVSMB7_01300 [Chloroflexota bacterium]
MTINTANIEKGMDVYDASGDKIGKVENVVHDPRAQTGMQSYQDAVNANVGSTAESDDADAERFTPGGAGTDTSTSDVRGTPAFAGSIEQGGVTAAGAGATPGGPNYGALGAFSASTQTGDVSDSSSPSGSASTAGYLHIKEGGLLGLGGKDLYVPTDQVEDVAPGDRITLRVTKAEAGERFTREPS